MRLELSGSIVHVKPLAVIFDVSGSFDAAAYMELGYTNFDVICIGGGGGNGGGIDTANTGTLIRNYGGEGGGGGFQRVRGLLSALPSICVVVVGAAGADGTTHVSTPASTTDGAPGGFSSFNGTTCRASGGLGGKRAQSNSATIATVANGGQGGIGNTITAGGGGLGGVAGVPTNPGPGTLGTDGEDGIIQENIGHGGGGGAGGVGKYGLPVDPVTLRKEPYNAGTAGGRGSYNPDDLLVAGPGEDNYEDPGSGTADIVPGRASGANASPLNGLPYIYGQSGTKGTVVILLTSE
jgi:hypothetical protein